MKLKDLIEMSAPDMSPDNVKNVNNAIDAVQRAYESAVIRKQANEDVWGPLVSAMRWFGQQPNPQAYSTWIRKGNVAVRTIKAARKELSANQAQGTSVK
jgi:hypothetical protein